MKKILLALLLFAPSVWSAVETARPLSTSDDWGGALNANVSYNGAWLTYTDSTYPGAGQASYIGWDGSARAYAHAVRFPSIDIPQGSTIDSAELWVRSGCNACTDSMRLLISIYDADDGFQVVDTDDFRSKFASRATGSGDLDTAYLSTTTSWALGTYVRIPSNKLDLVIQNNISRAGWTSGNSITLFVTALDMTASTLRRATREYSYSSGSTYDSLWISYTASGGGSPSATPNVVIRTATLHTTTLRSPEKLFRREETWKW